MSQKLQSANIGGMLTVHGEATLAVAQQVNDDDARTITAADYGKLVRCAGTAQAVTLPANGALPGSWFDILTDGDNNTVVTVSAATADTLITFNDQQADSVAFATGSRIGGLMRFISTGTYWVAINMSGGATMTVVTN